MAENFKEDDDKGTANLAEERRRRGPWLHAFHDPLADIKAFSSCIASVDVSGKGEYELLVADESRRLKVFAGTSLVSEHALLDQPSAMACFYTDLKKPQTPSVAVAAGPYIFIYRNLRPYYKFVLPPVDIATLESEVWASLAQENLDAAQAVEALNEARDNGVYLSPRSMLLLALNEPEEQTAFINEHKLQALVQMTVVTCMETMNKNMMNDRGISMLVVGTESRHVIIMDPSGTAILKKVQLPSVPVFMAITGIFEVEYRIVVTCRNGNIYTIKKGKVIGTVIELETQPCGLVVVDKNILVGCMDNVVHSFHFKGKKNYSIYLPHAITNMCKLEMARIRTAKCLVVALATPEGGEVRLYNGKSLISSFKMPDIVTAMKFGPYGREESSLLLCSKSGALTIKMLQRQAKLDISTSPPGPPPEQDIPLNIPKKTKLYVEQTQRERDQAIDMHRIFQRDLCKMRLTTARSYVKVITDGQGPLSSTGTSSLRLDAQVMGLGPLFKLKICVKNTGTKAVLDTPMTFTYDHSLYTIDNGLINIPVMVPKLEYTFLVPIRCIDENGNAGAVRVFVCAPNSCVPLISAIINMPMSEIDEVEG